MPFTNKWELNDFFRLLILIGLGMIASNFLIFRSMWLDEVSLATNILDRSFTELLLPLKANQVAPIGFLMVEKLAVNITGGAIWSLRIAPMIATIASAYFLSRVCLQLSKDVTFSLFATVLFLYNPMIQYYSVEIKQYAFDVLVALIMLWATLRLNKTPSFKSFVTISILGVCSIFFSNVAVISLSSCGLWLIYSKWKQRRLLWALILAMLPWLIAFVVYYVLFIHDHPSRGYMMRYWSQKGAFFDLGSIEAATTSTILKLESLANLFVYSRSDVFPLSISVLGLVVGVVAAFRSNRTVLYVVSAPIILHLVLSVLHLYPFATRLILYTLPLLVILCSFGWYSTMEYLSSRYHSKMKWVLLLTFIFMCYPVARYIPFERQEMEKALAWLDSHIEPTENIYIYYQARSAFQFYREFYPEVNSISNISIGQNNRNNLQGYVQEISALDSVTWVLFSNVMKTADKKDEREEIMNEIGSQGYMILEEYNVPGVWIYKVKE